MDMRGMAILAVGGDEAASGSPPPPSTRKWLDGRKSGSGCELVFTAGTNSGTSLPLPRKAKTYRAANGGPCKLLYLLEFFGAGEGIRTLDPNLGKVVLYP